MSRFLLCKVHDKFSGAYLAEQPPPFNWQGLELLGPLVYFPAALYLEIPHFRLGNLLQNVQNILTVVAHTGQSPKKGEHPKQEVYPWFPFITFWGRIPLERTGFWLLKSVSLALSCLVLHVVEAAQRHSDASEGAPPDGARS